MKAQEIFNEAGYQTSNSRNWENINKALSVGFEISLSTIGKVRQTKAGFVYDLKLSYNGKVRYINSNNLSYFENGKFISYSEDIISDYLIEILIAFKDTLIKNGLFSPTIAQEKGMCKCGKCGGKGKIQAFSYYCNGVCFSCMGLGFIQPR